MDMNTLIKSIAEAIAVDPAVDVWCHTIYGRPIHVYIGIDEENPPPADVCPCVCVFPNSKEYGGRQYEDVVECVSRIHDDALREYPGFYNIFEYAGVQNVESLRKVVVAVIGRVIGQTAATNAKNVMVNYDPVAQFPFFEADSMIVLNTPWTIGSGNPIENE